MDKIKSDLEDLALKYIEPDAYKQISYQKQKLQEQKKEHLEEIKYKINEILKEKEIPIQILLRTKKI